MPHIELPDGIPGINGPMTKYPETAQHLRGLAEALLRNPSSLTPAERELIATYVSAQNNCYFCMNSHAAIARHLYGEDRTIVDQAIADFHQAPLSDKMKALLVIAGKVQQGGRRVTEEDVALARAEGADDKAIHDTVLIAAAFCITGTWMAWRRGRRRMPPPMRKGERKWLRKATSTGDPKMSEADGQQNSSPYNGP